MQHYVDYIKQNFPTKKVKEASSKVLKFHLQKITSTNLIKLYILLMKDGVLEVDAKRSGTGITIIVTLN